MSQTMLDGNPEEPLTQRIKRALLTGKLVFRNETPMIIQRRLQWIGVPMVVLPVRVRV